VKRGDFESIGREEIYFTSETYAFLFTPADGATVPAIDFRPSKVAAVNAITRRVEAYHERLKGITSAATATASSIHDVARVKEPGLERLLRYDRWKRNCFRVLLFSTDKAFSDYEQLRLDEDAAIAAGDYRVGHIEETSVTAHLENDHGWRITKKIKLASFSESVEIVCDLEIYSEASATVQVGIESVLNFLAPDAPDRFIEVHDERHPLRWAAHTPASELRIVDEYQNISATLVAPGVREYWIAPIETVSDSEGGFERVFQGTQVLAVWPVEMKPGARWQGRLTLRLEKVN
jgi:alpha-amylase